MKYKSIKIDLNRDEILASYSKSLLNDFYMRDYEKSPQEAYARAAYAWSTYKGKTDEKLAQRLYDYVSKKWFLFASPVLSNAPNGEKNAKGLPISCFLTYVPDTIEGLIEHSSELRWLSIFGGGVGGHWSDVRTVSDVAPGPLPFLHTVDADMIAYRQGKTRKGSYAAYLDISHPDITEFINMRIPTGDVQRKALNLHNAVNISDAFMHAVFEGQPWNLIDPKDGSVKETTDARKLWERIIEIRFRTGEPYLNFIDTANNALPSNLKNLGLKIHGSNLCNEIHLPTSIDRTAVCCLSSVNLEYYDLWKDTQMVADITTMLDNVLEYFIENAPDSISRAKFSATRERSIGIGAMGFHSYLQSKNIPWEGDSSKVHNTIMFNKIKTQAVAASQDLAKERGEYLDGIGTGLRNAHLLAIAPNASSGIILSTSPSIEPLKANAYTHRTRGGSFLIKNKYLEALLTKIDMNTEKVWTSIITNKGSVQHLDLLTNEEKELFKTAQELDQRWVIELAADRQRWICQGQSVNVFFPAGSDKAYVNEVHLQAWEKGLKGLYYLRTEAKSRAETVSDKVERVALGGDMSTIIYGKDNCPFCSMAKDELEIRGIPFEYVDLELAGKTAAEVTGRKVTTIPQIYLRGEYIGGYDTLMAELNKELSQTLDTIEVDDDDECVACQG
jgi:ribonucleoside-diphosphate reductase alpha chain|tara:strand:- start:4953 stop:6968 length:2016 start_codon:yes stop_codon:yes gene_type:complete